MSTVFDDPRRTDLPATRFEADLERSGVPHEIVGTVMDALRRIAPGRTTLGLTAAELTFARAAGISDEVFSDQAQEENALYEAASAVVVSDEFRRSLIPTSEVAELLHKDAAHVRRMLSDRRLMAIAQTGEQSAYPRWQFVNGNVLPGLRKVLAAFPSEYHPLDIQEWMTTPSEELGGRSPQRWLATGGPASRIVELASDLAYM